MREHDRGRFPAWAERERLDDLAWIGENFHLFWPAAQQGHEELGGGVIIVDTTSRPTGEGNPFAYLPQEIAEKTDDIDIQRTMREYDPEEEFVVTLLKTYDRVSSYRIRPLGEKPGG